MPTRRKFGWRAWEVRDAAIAGALLIVFFGVPKSSRSRDAAQNQTERRSALPTTGKSAAGAFPFRPGETLDYRLIWSVFSNAAAVQLRVVETRDFFGTPAWHFRASAHSQVPLRSFAEVDDQFDSYAELATLDSKQYEAYLSELGERQTSIARMVSAGEPRPARTPVVLVKPHTRDPLAALYALRAFDWKHWAEFRGPVYDGEELYEMRATLEAADEAIQVAGRDERGTRISVRLFRGGQLSRTRCALWLSQDAARVPLVIQAEVPYGSVRAELVSRKD
jgi:uncharacterized protein DUF3108